MMIIINFTYKKRSKRKGGKQNQSAMQTQAINQNDKSNCPKERKYAEKAQFNPAIHLIEKEHMLMSKKRVQKFDKQKKKKRKCHEKEKNYNRDYEDLMLNYLLKENHTTKSPHLLISRRWFHHIKKNTVILKSVREQVNGRKRVVYYEIEDIGQNIKYIKKGNRMTLNPSTTYQNTIFIIVRLRDLDKISKLQFHTEMGRMVQHLDVNFNKEQCYVLLSIIRLNKDINKTTPFISNDDLDLMNRFFINQVSAKKGNYHFNMTGTIYGLGYGPKYNKNKYGHSIDKFANRKYPKKPKPSNFQKKVGLNFQCFLFLRYWTEKGN